MNTKTILAAVAVLLAVAAVAEARELKAAQVDVTIGNCKNYGFVNGRRVCTQCHDNHFLIPGGLSCERTTAGCRDPGFVGGRVICRSCHDNHVLAPGGMSCTRRVIGH